MNNQGAIPPKWDLIIDHSRREFDRQKSTQRQREYQRRLAYKQALDETLKEKHALARDDRQQDRRRYEAMIANNRSMDLIEQQKKSDYHNKLRALTKQNMQLYEDANRNQLQKEGLFTLASIQLGNPKEDGVRRYNNRKDMMEFYSRHIEEKKERERTQKEQDKSMIAKQQIIQLQREKEREAERKRILSHGQNPEIYQYYNSLNELGHIRERQLEVKLFQEAARIKLQKQDQKAQLDSAHKNILMEDVKKSLLEQMTKNKEDKLMQIKQRSQEQDQVIFEGQIKAGRDYKKEDYLAFLLKQEEMQKKRKREQKDMNALQYKINLPDLKKAVNGQPVSNSSPLYIGYSDEQQTRKDNIYFRNLAAPRSSSQTNRTQMLPEDSLDQFQRKLDRSVLRKLKPGSLETDFPVG